MKMKSFNIIKQCVYKFYIYDYNQFKKYEVCLNPGEYTYIEIYTKIKEKV